MAPVIVGKCRTIQTKAQGGRGKGHGPLLPHPSFRRKASAGHTLSAIAFRKRIVSTGLSALLSTSIRRRVMLPAKGKGAT